MCKEPETLVPMISTKPKQIVLIGDHKQLQPIIKCPAAKKANLGVSLFERYTQIHQPIVLNIQYRMVRKPLFITSIILSITNRRCCQMVHFYLLSMYFPPLYSQYVKLTVLYITLKEMISSFIGCRWEQAHFLLTILPMLISK